MAGVRREDHFGGDADRFYEALMRAHEGLSEGESSAFDARLILTLANQIGDIDILEDALRAALLAVRPGEAS